MGYKVAVVGATGNVGREIIDILHERQFPIDTLTPLASERSAYSKIEFGDQELIVQDLAEFDFDGYDFALFSAGGSVSEKYVPKATEADCIVIDNTSFFRMDKDVPLVVPGVNNDHLKEYKLKNIIANPNCIVAQLVMALKPLHEKAKIKRVVISTYQSVSGAGLKAMDELFSQTLNLLNDVPASKEILPRQIAFNVFPHIDDFTDNGYTKEEIKVCQEIQKIIDPSIKVTTTCVRVPVFIGHSASLNIEFETPLSVQDAKDILSKTKGVSVMDDQDEEVYATPIDSVGTDDVYVSRLRKDTTIENGLCCWVVSDNLRRGAALNAVEIAETIIDGYLNK